MGRIMENPLKSMGCCVPRKLPSEADGIFSGLKK